MTEDEIRRLLGEVDGITETASRWPGCKVLLRDSVQQRDVALPEIDNWIVRKGGTTHERYRADHVLPAQQGALPVMSPRIYVVPLTALGEPNAV
ncbi:MAG: hypothetical protein ABSG43_28410 [Solirubrobacteraceae bacterium]|jgi:hypothetical protein